MKISTRLFLYISTLFILLTIGFGYFSVRDERSHLMNGVKMNARTLGRTLAATFKYYHMDDQHQRLGELIHAVMPHADHANTLLLNMYDRRGQPIDLGFAHGSGGSGLNPNTLTGERLKGAKEQIIQDGNHEYFSVLSAIVDSRGTFQGTVEVLLSLDGVRLTVAALMRKFMAFILLTAILLGILIYLLSRWSITLPILRLSQAAEQLGHGDLGLRIQRSGVKELDALIEEFNRMALNIERQNKKKEDLFLEKLGLERGLRHQDKLASIGQLASGLAHEIGTPLNVISGRAEYLLEKGEAGAVDRQNLGIIIRQAERITTTMEQMLAFSRTPLAQFRILSLTRVVKESFSLCRLRQRRDTPAVELELDLAVVELMADEDGLRQLFINLMLNSFHAMPQGGTIQISSMGQEGDFSEVVVRYQDSGGGIPDSVRERIFDPFFTTKAIGEGTGLGLFMVANVVQEHQGRIELDPEVTGGAGFVIHLPSRPWPPEDKVHLSRPITPSGTL